MNVADHAGAITAALLALAVAAVPLARTARGPSVFYGLCTIIAAVVVLPWVPVTARHRRSDAI